MEIENYTTTLQLNPCFREINSSKKRYRVFKGGAGSGKSTNVANMLIKKLSNPEYAGCNLLCVRKVEASNRDSTLAELIKAIKVIYGDNASRIWKFPENRTSSMFCKCNITGSEIVFRGCNTSEDIEKIKSITFVNGKLTDIWIEEATEILEPDFNKLDDRLRGILPDGLFYQINLTFNPISSTHWLKRRFFDMPDENAITSHSTYEDNRFIDNAYRIRMRDRKERDPEGYKIYALGEWGEIGGLILTNWEVMDFDTSTIEKRRYGQDFGFNHANAILDVGFKDDNLYICREIYEKGKDMNDIITIADNQGWSKTIKMWCDSAEPDRILMWQKRGYNAEGVKKGTGIVKGQIDWLKGIVSKDKVENRRIYIHPSCINTIKEIQQWRWKLDNKSNTYLDEPVDLFDDAMAALRYSIEDFRSKPTSFGFF